MLPNEIASTLLIRAAVDAAVLENFPTVGWDFGEFYLAFSPDQDDYQEELVPYWMVEKTFPTSFFYVEFRHPVKQKTDQTETSWNSILSTVEKRLRGLETLLRLFRPGYIAIPSFRVWSLDSDGMPSDPKFSSAMTEFLSSLGTNPNASPVMLPVIRGESSKARFRRHVDYNEPEYPMDDDSLLEFKSFYAKYSSVLQRSIPSLAVSLERFRVSYERENQEEVLIDLMIALEALYSESGETSYKVAARSSSFIYPPGEARTNCFEKISQLFRMRNAILHGRKVKDKVADYSIFQDYMRQSLVKMLDLALFGKEIKAADFDQYFLQVWKRS